MKQSDIDRATNALTVLQSLDFDVLALWRDLEERKTARERREPSALDVAWPLQPAIPLSEHLAWGERKVEVARDTKREFVHHNGNGMPRPYLSCAIVEGRAYCLTDAQRRVLAEWYHMTASQTVEVMEVGTFVHKDTGTVCIERVIIRSEEHVDPQNKRLINGPRTVVIDRWGEFCSTALRYETEAREAAEVGRHRARVERLLERAKKAGVRHNIRMPGEVAHELHAAVQQYEVEHKRKAEADEVREMFKQVLVRRGARADLIDLVRDPKPRGVEVVVPVQSLDELMKQLGEGVIP